MDDCSVKNYFPTRNFFLEEYKKSINLYINFKLKGVKKYKVLGDIKYSGSA